MEDEELKFKELCEQMESADLNMAKVSRVTGQNAKELENIRIGHPALFYTVLNGCQFLLKPDLKNCKICGSAAQMEFCDTLDTRITAHAAVECTGCNNCSGPFVLPDDESIGNKRMGQLIEHLAIEHWNTING